MAITKHTKLPADTVTTAKIADNTIVNADIVSCAAITQSKISSLSTSLSNVCSAITSASNLNNTNSYNIALLGFKKAITESLTVFNLVDGIVDEFEDQGGTDESASTSLTYNSTDDYYINSNTPDGGPVPMASYSAGFTTKSITEPDTSVTGTNPAYGSGTFADYTVQSGITSLSAYVWGAGGGGGANCGNGPGQPGIGGGGGFTTGTISVTPSQVLEIVVGEGGGPGGPATRSLGLGGNAPGDHALSRAGGGLSGIFTNSAGTAPKSPQV